MSFEPQKFFIGLVDFFSILMPGALLAYLGRASAADAGYSWAAAPLDDTETWMIFLFASYLLGHFVFLIGARLDDVIYDPLRRTTTWGQIRRLARDRRRSPSLLRAMAGSAWLFDSDADVAVMEVQRIKARSLKGIAANDTVNTYQWCKARLSKEHAEGLIAVQRFEADSKFFRSFVVVLGLLAVFFRDDSFKVLICLGLMVLALWRYIDQRFKATQQAYWFVITLMTLGPPSPVASPAPRAGDGPTHAGGVVFRRNGAAIQYLLAQASTKRDEWVLPKGHIEPGEDPRETAVREVNEETGHWGRVWRWIQDVRLGSAPGAPTVRFYLMEAVQGWADGNAASRWPPENRQRDWLSLDDAKKRATFDDTKDLLEKADRIRAKLAADKKRK